MLYRIAAELDRGGHAFGAATTRRTTANRPDRPFTAGVEMRPGKQVHIDTNTGGIMCRYADGVTRRAELTLAVDVATRTICAGVIVPSTKAVDAVAVLARMVVPDPLRPGWPESLLFARSANGAPVQGRDGDPRRMCGDRCRCDHRRRFGIRRLNSHPTQHCADKGAWALSRPGFRVR